MCAVYAKYKNFKQYLLSLIVFASYTFLAGGLVIACCGLNYGVNDGFDFLNQNNLVPALGALAGIFVIFTVKKILNYIKNIKIRPLYALVSPLYIAVKILLIIYFISNNISSECKKTPLKFLKSKYNIFYNKYCHCLTLPLFSY